MEEAKKQRTSILRPQGKRNTLQPSRNDYTVNIIKLGKPKELKNQFSAKRTAKKTSTVVQKNLNSNLLFAPPAYGHVAHF